MNPAAQLHLPDYEFGRAGESRSSSLPVVTRLQSPWHPEHAVQLSQSLRPLVPPSKVRKTHRARAPPPEQATEHLARLPRSLRQRRRRFPSQPWQRTSDVLCIGIHSLESQKSNPNTCGEAAPSYLTTSGAHAHPGRQDVKRTARFLFSSDRSIAGSDTETRLSSGAQPSRHGEYFVRAQRKFCCTVY